MNPPLWAKSKKQGELVDPPTVAEHCRDVHEAALAVWDSIEEDLATGLACSRMDLRSRLRPLLAAAALLHDYAKINSAFQAILPADRPRDLRQPVRHEILGATLLVDSDFLGSWLERLLPNAEERWALIWAIAGHHMKMGDPTKTATRAVLFSIAGAPKEVLLPFSDKPSAELLKEAAEALNSGVSPGLKDHRFETIDDSDEGLEQRVARYAETAARAWDRLSRKNDEFRRRVGLLKALLISADASGSALTGKTEKPLNWVPKVLRARITSEGLEPVIREGTDGKKPHDFQSQVGAAETDATIVIAGTGNGKTTAAFLWAQKWAAGRKLFFTYPTTGTATAGYEDYLFEHRQIASDLIHSRAVVDLEAMRGSPEDDNSDEALRIESLRAWDRQAVVCTVDTVLGVMQNQKRSMYSFPAIVAGAFVFDEIHSYDSQLFGSLVRFLRVFPGIPVLLMSASIPPRRLDALKEVLGKRVGPIIPGDRQLEGYKRYRLERRESENACHDQVTEALRKGQKVLWVCNTVGDAIRTAREAKGWADVTEGQIIVYHSRFRYCDRVNRQKHLIEQFAYDRSKRKPWPRKHAKGTLAITTQVCEMSLDIGAELMVTAECPLPALVQRLGRLNRFAGSDDPWTCLVLPFTGDPYNERPERIQTHGDFRIEMAACRAVVAELHGKPCSQRDLAGRLDKMVREEDLKLYSAWLDDGWLTEPMPVREGDQSITVIWGEDLATIQTKLGNDRQKWSAAKLVPWTIPMNLRRGLVFDSYVGPHPVAPATMLNYSEREGAEWVKQSTRR